MNTVIQIPTLKALMYDNQHFKTKCEAIKKALGSCQLGIKWRSESISEKKAQIEKLEQKNPR